VYFEMMDVGDLQFPADPLGRVVGLVAPRATIGRFSSSRGDRPDIDLSTPIADPGVSHQHAVLEHRPDGPWSITDCGSSNGTYLNDDRHRLPPGDPFVLGPDDRIHVGAWTTIVIRPVPVQPV
jgi:pSer/pThr/pTyr-binding forkhead associated (FHA) protein